MNRPKSKPTDDMRKTVERVASEAEKHRLKHGLPLELAVRIQARIHEMSRIMREAENRRKDIKQRLPALSDRQISARLLATPQIKNREKEITKAVLAKLLADKP